MTDSSKLDLVVWDYKLELVRENLTSFKSYVRKKKGEEVDVTLAEYPWSTYVQSVTERLVDGKPCDVLYGSNEWLAEWVEDGHIVVLEDYVPEIRKYKADLSDFDRDGLSYHGRMVGLPYYADRFSLLYNTELLRTAGFDQPPTMWDELVSQSLQMKRKGLSFPFALALGYGASVVGSDPLEEYFSIAYSIDGGLIFDRDLNPFFETNSSAKKALTLISDGVREHRIIDPRCTEMGVVEVLTAISNGDCAFAILPSYDLKVINDPTVSRAAGRVKMALMPESATSLGYTRSYVMGASTTEREKALSLAWSLMEFLGGKTDPEENGEESYYVQKQWALVHGVNFAQKSLWEDPEVNANFSTWLDVGTFRRQAELAKSLPRARWWRRWYGVAAPILAETVQGKRSVSEGCQMFTESWNKLRSDD